ncbi:hypothetical protein [Novipirellula rosea]
MATPYHGRQTRSTNAGLVANDMLEAYPTIPAGIERLNMPV